MLFTYKYITHSIEKLQEYIDHLFLEVWCKANGEYDINKLHPVLKEMVLEIYYDEKIQKDHLYGPIEDIYQLFLNFDADQRKALKIWYQNNNAIEILCSGDNNCDPITYKALKKFSEELTIKIEKIFKKLFTDIIHLKSVWSRIGKIDDHYIEFMKVNDEGKCPFCGIAGIKGQYHTKREAYDHFLPKNIYPFNSINFMNLAPMCHECNSSYKTLNDPLYIPNHRDPLLNREDRQRKAFFPYSQEQPDIEIQMEINNCDIDAIVPNEIELKISSANHAEEVETWKEIFGIEERYKAKCCEKNDGKVWYHMIADEFENARTQTKSPIGPKELYDMTLRQASNYPYNGSNFLKKPFLEACEKAGLFEFSMGE
jgi:hypothetical protein